MYTLDRTAVSVPIYLHELYVLGDDLVAAFIATIEEYPGYGLSHNRLRANYTCISTRTRTGIISVQSNATDKVIIHERLYGAIQLCYIPLRAAKNPFTHEQILVLLEEFGDMLKTCIRALPDRKAAARVHV